MSGPGIWVCLIVLSAVSCQLDNRRDIRDYYFPLAKLTEGQVYEYRPVGMDSLAPDLRYFRSFIDGDKTVLTTTAYGPGLEPESLSRERMVANGMKQDALSIYWPGDNGKSIVVNAEVQAPDLFPFQVEEDGGIYLYKVSWVDPLEENHRVTVIRNRYYLGDTTVVIEEAEYPAVRFALKELIADDQVGVLEQTFTGEEIYALGLGLVYYSKDLGPQFKLAYKLADRYPMEELEEAYGRMLGHTDDE